MLSHALQSVCQIAFVTFEASECVVSATAHEALYSLTQVTDDCSVIGRNLFKKETNLQLFVGLKVTLSTGESGVIEGGFGQSGKFKIRIPGNEVWTP